MVSNVVGIAAGDNHSVALQADETVVVWGDSAGRQTRVPSELKSVVGISARADHTIAYPPDGSVVAWGNTNRMILPSGSANRNILSILASVTHTVTITAAQPEINTAMNSEGLDLSFWGFQGSRYVLEHSSEQPTPLWAATTGTELVGKWGWMIVNVPDGFSQKKRFYQLRKINE